MGIISGLLAVANGITFLVQNPDLQKDDWLIRKDSIKISWTAQDVALQWIEFYQKKTTASQTNP